MHFHCMLIPCYESDTLTQIINKTVIFYLCFIYVKLFLKKSYLCYGVLNSISPYISEGACNKAEF